MPVDSIADRRIQISLEESGNPRIKEIIMTWNNLPISRKIALLMGTLLVVICGLMVTSYITVNRLVRGTNSINETETISTIMLLREIDHLKWITSLQRFIFDEDMKELDIQVDHHKC